MRTPVGIAVVGASGRGPALMRTFDELPQATLRWIWDDSSLRPRSTPSSIRPSWTMDFDDLLKDEELDAIAFASTELAAQGRARAALEADKHVLVEGPLSYSSLEADTLVELAVRRSRRLWSHTAGLLRPATRRLFGLVERGAIGEIFYVHARRYVERDDRAPSLLWGPGAETVALVLELLADEPIEAVARGETYLGRPTPDVVFAELRFATGITAHIHLSCLEGETADRFCVVASEATAILDSGEPQRELALFASSERDRPLEGFSGESGSMIAFRQPPDDSARVACGRFLASIRSPGDPQHGRESAAVVAVVEALERSCGRQGNAEAIAPRPAREGANVVELRGR